tara:strand:+ start:132 stop:290 length:159 start_codon:yes stop_codon:yes gene_type:complete
MKIKNKSKLIFFSPTEYKNKEYIIKEFDIIPRCEFSKKNNLNKLKHPITQWL